MEVTQMPEVQKDKEQENIQDIEEEPYKTINTDVVFFTGLPTHVESFMEYDKEAYVNKNPVDYVWYWREYGGDYRQAYSYYEDELYDEKQLFAFTVRLGDFLGELPEQLPEESNEDYVLRKEAFLKDSYMQTFKEYNIYVIEDYPFSEEFLHTMTDAEDVYEMSAIENGGLEYEFVVYTNLYSCFKAQFAIAGTLQDIQALCKDEDITNEWCFRLLSAPRPDAMEWAINAGYDLDYWKLMYEYEVYRKPVLGEEWYVTCNANLFQKN